MTVAAFTTPRPRPGLGAREPSASQRNVSLLPDGPGSADGALPTTAAPVRASRVGDLVDHLAPQIRVLDDAALADPVAPDLELRLDHGQAVEPVRGRGQHGRQDLAQRDERDVDHDQVGTVRQLVERHRAGVGALDHGHARVLAQAVVELSVGHIERDHVPRRRAGAGSR